MRAFTVHRFRPHTTHPPPAQVQDALSYLRLALNPADDAAFLRVYNTPPRGLGAKFEDMLRSLQVRPPSVVGCTVHAVCGTCLSCFLLCPACGMALRRCWVFLPCEACRAGSGLGPVGFERQAGPAKLFQHTKTHRSGRRRAPQEVEER